MMPPKTAIAYMGSTLDQGKRVSVRVSVVDAELSAPMSKVAVRPQ